jgi:hypothetical protein
VALTALTPGPFLHAHCAGGAAITGTWLKCPAPPRALLLELLYLVLLKQAPAFTHVLQLSADMKMSVSLSTKLLDAAPAVD